MVSKFQLRQQYRAIRAKIPIRYREEAANSAAKLLLEESCFKKSERIACYLPVKEEFDSSALIASIWKAKKECFVPVLDAKEPLIHFVEYEYGDALHRNRFSILEPVDTSRKIAPQDLDLVITPLIAFDRAGNRLGTGGGFYDRAFAFLHENPGPPWMWGLGYASQEAPHIPVDPWDIRLQAVITEKQVLEFNLS